MSFTASYAGTCACCDERFPGGTEVAYTFDGLVIASHIKDIEEKEEICDGCFTVKAKNGACSCPT